MAYTRHDRIYIRTNYRGFITPLGMAGPIVIPIQCEIEDVMKMVMGGMEIFEVDPTTKKTVLLTLTNILDDTKMLPTPVNTYNIGKATQVTETTGVTPPVKVTEAQPLISKPVTGTPEDEAVALKETEEEAPVEEKPANTLLGQVTNPDHLTKAQRRKLRQQQQQAAAAAAQNAAESGSEESTTEDSAESEE